LAADTSVVTGIAGRYAIALFELAEEQKALDAVVADLDRLKAIAAESADFTRLLSSPIFSRAEQGRAVEAVLAQAGIGELVRRFAGVVAANRRLSLLLDIVAGFRALLARHRGETVAKIVSASPLSAEQIESLKRALRDAVGREVFVDTRIDPALIGGLVVQLGSRMVDASVRTKLENLKVAMKGVA